MIISLAQSIIPYSRGLEKTFPTFSRLIHPGCNFIGGWEYGTE